MRECEGKKRGEKKVLEQGRKIIKGGERGCGKGRDEEKEDENRKRRTAKY